MTQKNHILDYLTEEFPVCNSCRLAILKLNRMKNMGLNQLDTTMLDDLTKQISIKVLSNHDGVYATWTEKDQVIMNLHYCKQTHELQLLEGSLGVSIQESSLSEEQKIFKCSEALEKVIMTQKSLANIRRHKELIEKNHALMLSNQKIIDRSRPY